MAKSAMAGCSIGGAGAAGSIEINAPAEVVWQILLDIEGYPELFSTCVSVEKLSKKKSINPLEAGAKYTETGFMPGVGGRTAPYRIEVTATVVEEFPAEGRRVAGFATTLYNSTATSTFTVETIDNTKCRLAISYALVPNGLYGKLYLWVNRSRMLRDGSAQISSEFQSIKSAAESKLGE